PANNPLLIFYCLPAQSSDLFIHDFTEVIVVFILEFVDKSVTPESIQLFYRLPTACYEVVITPIAFMQDIPTQIIFIMEQLRIRLSTIFDDVYRCYKSILTLVIINTKNYRS